jgi:glycosidase
VFVTVPYWVQDSIFYQIFPDRFANGDKNNDPPNVERWGSTPTSSNFMGGDLRGIIQKFDYLLDLGITAIYLNPIFHSPSNHRYNTIDYYRIDPKLGDMVDFRALLAVAHNNGVRLVLDGVFNHCGRGFFAFNDVLELQDHSPYKDWYHIRRFPVDAYGPGEARDYLGWWGYKSLPKFNIYNPAVRRFLLNVGRYWMDQGADGWRLDVPNEIDDDSFWAEFRDRIKSINPDAYLFGEIWTAEPRWVGDDHFDGLMNYPLRDAVLEFLEGSFLTASGFAQKVEDLLNMYPRENVYAMYLPLGSHDTERLMTRLGGNLDKVKQAFLFHFAYPGAPAIYYGDEVGMSGGKDPASRGAFPWDPAEQVAELHAWIQTLVTLRKQHGVLRRGDYRQVFVDDRSRVYAFARTLGSEKILVVMNAGPAPRHLQLPVGPIGFTSGQILKNLLGREEYVVNGNTLEISLAPWVGAWIG